MNKETRRRLSPRPALVAEATAVFLFLDCPRPVEAAMVSYFLDQSNQVRAGFAINGSGVTSAYFGGLTPVPLPETGWLLLSGLAALAWLAVNTGLKNRPGALNPVAPAT